MELPPVASQVTPVSTPPKVQFHGVSKRYSSRGTSTLALSDIELEICQNEMVCIIGESGCGKSTLLHMVSGFETSTAGQILVDGLPFSGPSHKRGVVFQEASLLPWLTVEKNISLGLDIRKCYGEERTKVQQLIEVMGLKDFRRYRPGQLSGGMAQRVAIARALVNSPEILLLDEPFGALDAFTRICLQDELLRIWQHTPFTGIFVTHDIDEAVYIGRRIVVLTPRPGRIARIFDIPLDYPRDRASIEFIRLRSLIAKEFLALRT